MDSSEFSCTKTRSTRQLLNREIPTIEICVLENSINATLSMHQRSSVVEYYSKSLSPMAKRYLEFEKELFAIVCTLKKWSMHLDDEFNLLMNENYIVDYYRMSRDKGVSCRVRLWCKIISSYPIIFNGHYD